MREEKDSAFCNSYYSLYPLTLWPFRTPMPPLPGTNAGTAVFYGLNLGPMAVITGIERLVLFLLHLAKQPLT
jgi:hypothetical protein